MTQANAQTLKVEVVQRGAETYTVLEVPSSDGKRTYRVDITNQRCSCPAWIYQKGARKHCKHLKAFGFKDMVAAQAVETKNGMIAL